MIKTLPIDANYKENSSSTTKQNKSNHEECFSASAKFFPIKRKRSNRSFLRRDNRKFVK